jgi:hypothetical protein
VAPRRPPASFQIGSVGPAAADSRILLWMQQSQGVDDVPWRVRPGTDPHRPALRSPACGMSAIRGEGLPGWGNVSRRWCTWLGRGIRVQAQSVGRDGICGMAGIVDVAAQRGDQSQPCWIDWPGCL